jgi:hypothetical protein
MPQTLAIVIVKSVVTEVLERNGSDFERFVLDHLEKIMIIRPFKAA